MQRPGRVFWAALLAGVVVRAAILWHTPHLDGRIEDERQYLDLAASLFHGRGFAWASGEPTSLRPPLYPALLAMVWTIAGEGALQTVRVIQCALSLLTAWIVCDLGRRLFNEWVGTIAFAIVWLYPALIFLDITVLTETLFTFLLVAFVALAIRMVRAPSPWTAALCGLALGLGALTRSVLWPVPIVFAPLLVLLIQASWRTRLSAAALFLAGYGLVVAPWAVRNTRLQQVPTIVDTMGGMNLRMGNYEFTPEDRMWDAVSLRGDRSWVHLLAQEQAAGLVPVDNFTEGMKDKWAQRKAIEYMRQHPGQTLRRAAIKFADFWGLDRSLVAGVQQGLYRPPTWFAVAAIGLSLVSCAGVLLLGAVGIFTASAEWRAHVLLLLPVVIITGVHSIVFGHPRYHDPLVPILAVYAAAVLDPQTRRSLVASPVRVAGASIAALVLVAIWTRQVVIVDGAKIAELVKGVL